MYKHLMILELALSSIWRRRYRNLLMIMVYAIIIFMFASLVFLTDSLKTEAFELLRESPPLIVQKLKGGRHDLIPEQYAQKIIRIRGVGKVSPRYWGYYFDPATQANFTFWGADTIEPRLHSIVEGRFFSDADKTPPDDRTLACVIGQGVSDIRFIGLNDVLPVTGSDGNLYVLRVSGIFTSPSRILTNDLIVMGIGSLKTIFEIPENMATDLAVQVRNSREIDTVARKIQALFPSVRVISKNQIRNTYKALFGWRSGLTAALLFTSVAAFAILAWDKALGATDSERKEIGILKAVGCNTSEVLALKFYEGLAISAMAFLTGLMLAYIHVFYWGGVLFVPVLRGWSVLFPKLRPVPYIDIYNIMAIIFLGVFPYIASTIIPFWKAAVTDPDVVMK